VFALVLALAAVAISVPVAQGARPDDRAVHGVGAVTTPTALPDAVAALRAQPAPAIRPDDRPGVRGPGIVASSPFLSRSIGQGFAWGDAALGASAMLALCCLLGAVFVRQHRKVALG